MSEAKLQAKIIKWLEDNGYYVVKTIVSNKKGVPDILACSPKGRFVAIEVKFGVNKASMLQEYNLKRIRERGGISILAYDLATVIAHLSLVDATSVPPSS